MKKLIIIVIILAAAIGARAADEGGSAAEKSLRSAGEGLCAAGIKGDASLLFDFFFHPAMMKQAIEAAGFESEQQMRDFAKAEMEKEMKDNALEKCAIGDARVEACKEFAVEYFAPYELKPAQCGTLVMVSKTVNDDDAKKDTLNVGQVDGKWYVVLSAPVPDAPEGGDAGLGGFAGDFCAAFEKQDIAAFGKMALGGIKQPSSMNNVSTLNWDEYIRRLTNSWAMNVEPVSCTVANVRSFGECDSLAAEVYAEAGYKDVVCGKIELSVFMDKDMWVNTVGAVQVEGAWHADASTFVKLTRALDKKSEDK